MLRAQLDNVVPHSRNPWLQFHPYTDDLGAPVARDRAQLAAGDEDRRLVVRIIEAYRRTVDESFYGDGSMWQHFRERQGEIHDALVRQDVEVVTEILRHPERTDLLYGYEMYRLDETQPAEQTAQELANLALDLLMRLAEALGVAPVENPEGELGVLWGTNLELDPDAVVGRIEARLGCELPIVHAQTGLSGLAVRDGFVNNRTITAAYFVHRMRQLLGDATGRVLEIGPGLGYTAVYADRLGIDDYTIVDLPMTNVAQAYFIGRTVGEDRIVLEGEPGQDRSDAIKIRTPTLLRETAPSFDLIANMDSLTEVGRERAGEYAAWIRRSTPTFLSVNHEGNGFAVGEVFEALGASVDRFPFWLRTGYTEDIIRIPSK